MTVPSTYITHSCCGCVAGFSVGLIDDGRKSLSDADIFNHWGPQRKVFWKNPSAFSAPSIETCCKIEIKMGHLDSTSESTFRLHVAMIILATLAVCLRFFARAITRLAYGADDWWILLSLAFFLTDMSLGIRSEFNHRRAQTT